MQPTDVPSLHPHQQAVLAKIVAAYEQNHREFSVSSGGTRISHRALDQVLRVRAGDIAAFQRAGMIDVVATNSQGEVSTFAPTAKASLSVDPFVFLCLTDEAWAVAKGTLGNEPERIRDVQHILSRIDDDDESSEGIKETARAARILLGQVERYVEDGKPTYEPTARVSADGLRALAASILRQGSAHGPLAIALAEKVREMFG